jgi:hypothetical protein
LRKLIASLIMFAAPSVVILVPTTAAHAASAVHYMAPGVAGNGPLVFVDGNPVSTNGNGFEGWVGCYK